MGKGNYFTQNGNNMRIASAGSIRVRITEFGEGTVMSHSRNRNLVMRILTKSLYGQGHFSCNNTFHVPPVNTNTKIHSQLYPILHVLYMHDIVVSSRLSYNHCYNIDQESLRLIGKVFYREILSV